MVPIEGLPKQQQMLVAGFAKSAFTHEELKKFAELLAEINKNNCLGCFYVSNAWDSSPSDK